MRRSRPHRPRHQITQIDLFLFYEKKFFASWPRCQVQAAAIRGRTHCGTFDAASIPPPLWAPELVRRCPRTSRAAPAAARPCDGARLPPALSSGPTRSARACSGLASAIPGRQCTMVKNNEKSTLAPETNKATKQTGRLPINRIAGSCHDLDRQPTRDYRRTKVTETMKPTSD
ncbi:hypothetical protein VTK26DRAFT_5751 [Humicola hyalothermophila]